MSTPRQVRVIALVDARSHPGAVAAMRQAGLEVEAEHTAIGSVSGTIREDRLPALAAVEGVEAVERERTHRIPPPDSPVQ